MPTCIELSEQALRQALAENENPPILQQVFIHGIRKCQNTEGHKSSREGDLRGSLQESEMLKCNG